MPTKSSRPSAALVVASLALVVALGGTAFAAPIRHLVASINGATIQDHSIAGDKLKNDTVTGRQVRESSLGTVPNADRIGGFTVRKIFYAPAHNSAIPKTILQLGGLVLKGTCEGGAVSVAATGTVDHADLTSELWKSAGGGAPGGLHLSDFGPHSASHFATLDDGNAWGHTSFTYTRANGTIVNGQLSFDSTDLNTSQPGDNDIFDHTAKCLISGFAMSTASS